MLSVACLYRDNLLNNFLGATSSGWIRQYPAARKESLKHCLPEPANSGSLARNAWLLAALPEVGGDDVDGVVASLEAWKRYCRGDVPAPELVAWVTNCEMCLGFDPRLAGADFPGELPRWLATFDRGFRPLWEDSYSELDRIVCGLRKALDDFDLAARLEELTGVSFPFPVEVRLLDVGVCAYGTFDGRVYVTLGIGGHRDRTGDISPLEARFGPAVLQGIVHEIAHFLIWAPPRWWDDPAAAAVLKAQPPEYRGELEELVAAAIQGVFERSYGLQPCYIMDDSPIRTALERGLESRQEGEALSQVIVKALTDMQ